MLHDKSNNQSRQTPYALVKLSEAVRVITQSISEMTLLRKRLEKYKDNKVKAHEVYDELQQQQNRLSETLSATALSLHEVELPDIADYSMKLSQSIKSFNLFTPDYTKLCATLNNYISKLQNSINTENADNKTTNASIIGRLMNNVKVGYYPTDLENVKQIARGIQFPENINVNILDPCCGCGTALQTLTKGNNCTTYGIEIDSHRADESLKRLNRVGFGSYFHSRIGHESFHAMLLNPPYISVMAESGSNTRSEKRFLIDTICHLMYDGLLIYIIPFYRLTQDIFRVLCDNFKDITIWKFSESEFKKYKQVAIMGIRQKRIDDLSNVPILSSSIMAIDKLPELAMLPNNRYQLPTVSRKVMLFKGAKFNITELSEQLYQSNSFSKLFERNKLDTNDKRPLLPLNIGQIGLVGGSGLINGLVECDTPHIIKGRIVKEKNTTQEENLNSRGDLISSTVYETSSNKMIFNILTSDGFKSLS